jgi:hypothetical protein
LEFLVRAIRQEEKINGMQIRKEEIKLPLFADVMILHLKDPINSTKKLLEIINTFRKVAGQNQYTKIGSFSIHKH